MKATTKTATTFAFAMPGKSIYETPQQREERQRKDRESKKQTYLANSNQFEAILKNLGENPARHPAINMSFSTQAISTPSRARRTVVTPATPETPAYGYRRNNEEEEQEPCTEYELKLLDKMMEAQAKKSEVSLQLQKAALDVIATGQDKRHEQARHTQLAAIQGIERVQMEANKEHEHAQQQAKHASEHLTKEALAATEKQYEPVLQTISGMLSTAGRPRPTLLEDKFASPAPFEDDADYLTTPKVSAVLSSSKKRSTGSRPPLSASSSVKRMKVIGEDTPVESKVQLQRVKTSAPTERMGLIVFPNGKTLFVPTEWMSTAAYGTPNDSHLSFLSVDGKVTVFPLPGTGAATGNQEQDALKPSILSRLFSPGSAKKASSKTSTELEFPVAIQQLAGYGSRTMAVGANGEIFSYGKELEPLRMDPLACVSKPVEVHPGGTFFVVKLEDDSYHIFRKYSGRLPSRCYLLTPSEYYTRIAAFGEEGSIKTGHIQLPRGRNIRSVIPGHDHCLLIAHNKTARGNKTARDSTKKMILYTTGNNSHGQLGHGDKKERRGWTEVLGGFTETNIIDAAAGSLNSFAVNADGELSFFGAYAGQDAKKPRSIDLDFGNEVKFKALVAADKYVIGLEQSGEFDDNALMLNEDGKIHHLGTPEDDNRIIVEVISMRAASTYSFLEVEVATPTDAESDFASDSGTTQ
jgi:hypothetical protein